MLKISMGVMYFHCCIVLIASFNIFAMNTSKNSFGKNKKIISFNGFCRLPLPVIAQIFTGTSHLSIYPSNNDQEKEMRQKEAICLYSNPAIRNALFKVNKMYYSLFSWEKINPILYSSNVRAESENIQQLLRRNSDEKYRQRLENHYSLQYTFFNTDLFIIGCNECIALRDELHPLVKACISRCPQDVTDYLHNDKKYISFNENKTKIIDLCLCAIVQNNDYNSLQVLLNNKYIRNTIIASNDYISKLVQLGIYCGSTKVIEELMFLYNCFSITIIDDYIANEFKNISHRDSKPLFKIIIDNMQIIRKRNSKNLHNLLYCLAFCFNTSDITKLQLNQSEIDTIINIKNTQAIIYKNKRNKMKYCAIQ